MRAPFTGFFPLYKVALRENRHQVAPWIALITVLSVTSFIAYHWVFPEMAQRKTLEMTIGSNPAFNLIFGPAHNLLTADGFNAWRSLALGNLFAGLMGIFVVVRETREKEDSGQAELVGASVVGHYTQLAVAVAVAWAASIALGIVVGLATVLIGGNLLSSVVLAVAFCVSGMMWACFAAVTCQLASYADTASSIAVTVLGMAFLLRGYADTSPDLTWLIWLSPLGWLQKMEPAGANVWWPLLLCGSWIILLLVVANVLLAHRDFGQGFLPSRPGNPRAGFVKSIFGLTLRTQGGSIVQWTAALALIGAVFGMLISSLGSVFAQSAAVTRVLANNGSHTDFQFEFLITLLRIISILAAVYGAQVMSRFYGEEMGKRIEPLLAGAVNRLRLFGSHVAVALIGPAVGILISGVLIAWVAHVKGVNIDATHIIQQAASDIAAVWVLIGVSIATVGARPIARLAGWAVIVGSFLLTILGPILNLWDWVLGISPLWHVPNVTDTNPDWIQLLWLALIFLFFLIIGCLGYARRDIDQS